jgi:hypothetical protein
MLALSGQSIVMDVTSELGPIDPQRRWIRRTGASTEPIMAPAWAIKEQWLAIDRDLKADPSKINQWYPIISQFAPSLLVECDTALALARTLVQEWLETGMFKAEADPKATAQPIVDALSDHGRWMSHGRAINIDDAVALGLRIVDLRAPEQAALADAFWPAWHAVDLTLDNTGAVKIFENSQGESRFAVIAIEARQAVFNPRNQPQAEPPGNRAQRRAETKGRYPR